MAKSSKTDSVEPVLAELLSIKRLLVFALLKSGASQAQVAGALGLTQSRVSRMFPTALGNVGNPRSRKR